MTTLHSDTEPAKVAKCCAWVLLGGLCLLPSLGNAQPDQREFVALDYHVDAALNDCPSEDEFRARVAWRLGYDPHQQGADVGVEVRAWPTRTGLKGYIRWSGTDNSSKGQREIDSPTRDCARLMATMAFVLAVQIQMTAGDSTSLTTEPPPNVPQASPRDDTEGRDTPRPPASTPRASPVQESLAVTGGIGPALGIGLAPETVLQGRLFFAVQHKALSVELGAEVRPPSTTTLSDGTGFRHQMVLGSLAACGHRGFLAVCGVTKIGRLQVVGEGVDRPAAPAGLVAQVGPRLAYLVPFGAHLGVLGHVDASYLLSPWTVQLDGAPAWTMPRLSAMVGIDVVAIFP